MYLFNIVMELIATIDPNQNGILTYDEFLLVLRYIEERQIQQPGGGSRLSNQQNVQTDNGMTNIVVNTESSQQQLTSSKFSLSETDRKMYDVLLPKQGVYFLPDEKLIAFLK